MSGRTSPLSKDLLKTDVSMLSPSPERNVLKKFSRLGKPLEKVNFDKAFESTDSSIISLSSPKNKFKSRKKPNDDTFSRAFEITANDHDLTSTRTEEAATSNFRSKKVATKNISFSKAFETTYEHSVSSENLEDSFATQHFGSKKEGLKFAMLGKPLEKVNFDEAFDSTECSLISLSSPKNKFKPRKKPSDNTFSRAFEITTNDHDLTSTRTEDAATANFRSKKVATKNITFSKAFETTHEHSVTSEHLEDSFATQHFRSKKEGLKNSITFSEAFEVTNEHDTTLAQNEMVFKTANFRANKKAVKNNLTFSNAFEKTKNCERSSFLSQTSKAKFQESTQILESDNRPNKDLKFLADSFCRQSSAFINSEESSDTNQFCNVFRNAKFKLPNQKLMRHSKSSEDLKSLPDFTCSLSSAFMNSEESSEEDDTKKCHNVSKPSKFESSIHILKCDNKSCEDSESLADFTCGQSSTVTNSGESSEGCNTNKRHDVSKPSYETKSNNQYLQAVNDKVYNPVTSCTSSNAVKNAKKLIETSPESSDPVIKFTQSLNFVSPILPVSSENEDEQMEITSESCHIKNNFKKYLSVVQNEFIQSSTLMESLQISENFTVKSSKYSSKLEESKVAVDISGSSKHQSEKINSQNISDSTVDSQKMQTDVVASSADSSKSQKPSSSLSQYLTPILNKIANDIQEKNLPPEERNDNKSNKKPTEKVTNRSRVSNSQNKKNGDNTSYCNDTSSGIFRVPKRPLRKKTNNSFTAHDLSLHLLSKCSRPKKRVPLYVEHTLVPEPSAKKVGKENRSDICKLKRPSYWATNKLYLFLEEKLEIKYGPYAKAKAESFVKTLTDTAANVVKCNDINERSLLIDNFKSSMIQLRLVKSDFYFYQFIMEFLPFEFVDVAVPCVLPFSEKLNVSNFKPENLFTKYFD